jgi:hypothetical protein
LPPKDELKDGRGKKRGNLGMQLKMLITVLIVLSKIQHQQDLRAVEKQNKGT